MMSPFIYRTNRADGKPRCKPSQKILKGTILNFPNGPIYFEIRRVLIGGGDGGDTEFYLKTDNAWLKNKVHGSGFIGDWEKFRKEVGPHYYPDGYAFSVALPETFYALMCWFDI